MLRFEHFRRYIFIPGHTDGTHIYIYLRYYDITITN